MKRVLRISRYPAALVFVLAGLSAVVVAFASYNLLAVSMANLHFLREHGWTAIRFGALWQLFEIVAYGVLALVFFLLFKICESELVLRYRRWQDR
ncbi:MAG: hypothetical protein R3D85_04895 [Paracoccaceae bacterium]